MRRFGAWVVLLAPLAGCAVVTDLKTTGYTLRDAGACDGSAGPACTGSGAVCSSGAGCLPGQICCLTAELTAFTTACQAGPTCSGTMGAQLCAADAECEGGTCIAQICSAGGTSVTIHTCGVGTGLSAYSCAPQSH